MGALRLGAILAYAAAHQPAAHLKAMARTCTRPTCTPTSGTSAAFSATRTASAGGAPAGQPLGAPEPVNTTDPPAFDRKQKVYVAAAPVLRAHGSGGEPRRPRLAHGAYGTTTYYTFCKRRSFAPRLSEIERARALHGGVWFDHFIRGTLATHESCQRAEEALRQPAGSLQGECWRPTAASTTLQAPLVRLLPARRRKRRHRRRRRAAVPHGRGRLDRRARLARAVRADDVVPIARPRRRRRVDQ